MLAAASNAAAPGEQWIYDPAGYTVAGLAAEAVTHKPLAALVHEEIGGPLAVARFAPCAELAPTRAQPYMAAGGVTQPVPDIAFGWLGGGGSICGTTGDLARWWLAVRSGQVISPASLQEWMTPAVLERNGVRAEFGYGLGLRLGSYGGHTVMGHVGDGAGGTTVLAEYPDDRLLIVVASNTAGPGVPHMIEVQAAIARELLGIAVAPVHAAAVGPESLTTVPGLYRSPEGRFCVQTAGEELAVATDEQQAVTLTHLGDGRFSRRGADDSLEYFLGWPDRTEWFGYAWFGLPMDLAAKESDVCP